MESSLHRQLKELYADEAGQVEVRLGRYRVDAIAGGWLVEIQQASLAAIREKVARLIEDHPLLVVKPLVMRKQIIKRRGKRGRPSRPRWSPKRGRVVDLFDDFVSLARLFPHPRLMIDLVEVEVVEHRRVDRRRRKGYVVEDRRLTQVLGTRRLRVAADLLKFLPPELPSPFHSGHLADELSIERWEAQRIAYCLLHGGALDVVGKRGNTRLYEPAENIEPSEVVPSEVVAKNVIALKSAA